MTPSLVIEIRALTTTLLGYNSPNCRSQRALCQTRPPMDVEAIWQNFKDEWAAGRVHSRGHTANLLEAGKESLLSAFANEHVLHASLLSQLGAEAIATVRRLISEGRLNGRLIEPLDAVALSSAQGSQPGNP